MSAWKLEERLKEIQLVPQGLLSIGLSVILLFSTSSAAEVVEFYHTDAAGTVVAITDASGQVIWRQSQQPFGVPQSTTGSTTNPLGFTGKPVEPETGLVDLGARWYSPKLGRFLQVDPALRGGIPESVLREPQRLNPYVYGVNNPDRYVETEGRWPTEIHNRIIDAAFSEGRFWLSASVRRIFKVASRHVDKDQSAEGAYKHAMRTPNQTPEEAQRLMEAFIKQKVEEYKTFMAQGRTQEAHFALGEAMHPLMDSTSPVHEGFQEWKGIFGTSVKEHVEHSRGERAEVFNSNPEYMRKSVELLRRLYDEIK